MEPVTFAQEAQSAIEHAILAHTQFARTPRDTIRFWDGTTPYFIHPLWCAMTLLTETTLPDDVRHIGYQVLLWHDTLEDTRLALPSNARTEVTRLVNEMTFTSFSDEMQHLWERSDLTKLLKLYDKVSNLLDGTWMQSEKWNSYVAHTLKLTAFVETKYGDLNIVKMARAICVTKSEQTTA